MQNNVPEKLTNVRNREKGKLPVCVAGSSVDGWRHSTILCVMSYVARRLLCMTSPGQAEMLRVTDSTSFWSMVVSMPLSIFSISQFVLATFELGVDGTAAEAEEFDESDAEAAGTRPPANSVPCPSSA